MSREGVLLAKTFNPEKDVVNGWYGSEKLDGMRFVWDGGATMGMKVIDVPFANKLKIDRFKHHEELISTGLWSRYWNPIYAPEPWVASMLLEHYEGHPVEGELMHPDGFQKLVSITKRVKDCDPAEWLKVSIHAFDAPPPRLIWEEGEIRVSGNQKFKMGKFDWEKYGVKGVTARTTYNDRLDTLHAHAIKQQAIKDNADLMAFTKPIVDDGGEGAIIRSPNALYMTKRSGTILKVKPRFDAEGVVTETVDGKGKHVGRIGALVIKSRFGVHELGTGLTDNERDLNPMFWIGKTVEFTYRGLTDKGLPKEAAYKRIRDDCAL